MNGATNVNNPDVRMLIYSALLLVVSLALVSTDVQFTYAVRFLYMCLMGGAAFLFFAMYTDR